MKRVQSVKYWGSLVTAAVLIAGCGGSSSSPSSDVPGGGVADRDIPEVMFGDTDATVELTFLSGPGRRAGIAQSAVFRSLRVQNSVTDFVPLPNQINAQGITTQLDSYTNNSLSFPIEFTSEAKYDRFTQLPLELSELFTQITGERVTLVSTPVALSPAGSEQAFNLDLTAFPGRRSGVQIKLDNTMLFFDSNTGLQWDPALFVSENYDSGENAILSRLSDMVAFDLTTLPEASRPTLISGSPAEMILLSGDKVALSAGFGSVDSFNVMEPVQQDLGTIRQPTILDTNARPTQGTYSLMEPDPTVINDTALTINLQGTWVPFSLDREDYSSAQGAALPQSSFGTFYSQLATMRNFDDEFNMLVFPNSRQSLTMDAIVFAVDNGQLVDFFKGTVTLAPDRQSGSVTMYPVSQVGVASKTGAVTGTLSDIVLDRHILRDEKGNITEQDDVLSAGAVSFSGSLGQLPTSGTFIVYR
ncbi:MAG: hypothetical protein ACOCX1_03975 [Fimbriimonadaceae bacterium]